VSQQGIRKELVRKWEKPTGRTKTVIQTNESMCIKIKCQIYVVSFFMCFSHY